MARDRQRAKQRKARRSGGAGPGAPGPAARRGSATPAQHEPGAAPGPATPSQPERDTAPDAWQHGGEVDEAVAAVVAGADGETAEVADAELERQALEEVGDLDDDGDIDDTDRRIARGEDELEPAGGGGAGRLVASAGGDGPDRAPARRADAPVPGKPTPRGIGRFVGFLRASWAELQRVQWPDRRQVGQATAVVLGFVVIAGAYLGLADAVAQRIVDFIL